MSVLNKKPLKKNKRDGKSAHNACEAFSYSDDRMLENMHRKGNKKKKKFLIIKTSVLILNNYILTG